MTHVFIVGSKGIPAQYGGFETFVENLTAGKQSPEIVYHVSCMNNDEKHFEHNGADCFNVRVPLPGAPGRIFHVGLVLTQVEEWAKSHPQEKVIVCILGCRIGPLLIPHAHRLHKLGAKVYCNPDGLEWKRSKWSAPAKMFLRYCEKCLVENSDLAICDSVNIEKYIKDTYGSRVKDTTFIAYGAYTDCSQCSEEKLTEWYHQFNIKRGSYYLIVGRFVPENNYETMITEFMRSKTTKDLVIITNVEHNKFYEQLREKTGFEKDSRIKFVGTVYDQDLLIVPSKCMETFSFVVLEGLTNGASVICSDLVGAKLFLPKENIFKHNDAESLAEAIRNYDCHVKISEDAVSIKKHSEAIMREIYRK